MATPSEHPAGRTARLLFFFGSLLPATGVVGQCQLAASASQTTITCGTCVTLSAFGNGTGNVAFTEDFNSGAPVGWQFTQSATFSNPCSPGGVDGTPHLWMGDASPNPRDMVTVPLDLSLGGSICFDMLFAEQGDNSPCEGPDEPQEGVYLQYSIDGGATWQTIHYFNPNGGYDAQLTNWNNWCFALPLAAATSSTMIRWHQDDVSGSEYDHWGIDNVTIILNDPNFAISWLHDGYNYGLGAPGGPNPTPVCPMTTTTYTAQVSDGITTCTDQVTITVVDPVIVMTAGNDTTICPGDCVTLDADAFHLVSPASTPTYSNNQFQLVAGGTASVNINVQGLNTTSLVNGSITQVCVNSFTFGGSSLCTNFAGCNCNGVTIPFLSSCDLTAGSFEVTLNAPGGCGSITLVPIGNASGDYSNVCFVPAGGTAQGPGFPGGGGPWAPAEPISDLNGCDPNGVWTLTFSSPGLAIGFGALTGWSISFDDPEITEPVNVVWSPTTNMTGETTLSPEVCPTTTTTYTLSATDLAGCITVTDDVTITIGSCCALQIDDVAVVDATCGAADGTITVSGYSGDITGLVFSLNGGAPQASPVFTGLAPGTYTLVANDDNDCPVQQEVVVGENGGPEILGIVYYPPTCAGGDGSIVITAAGADSYSIDNGATIQASNTFDGLNGGSYPVVVTSPNGCTADTVAILAAAPDAPVIDLVGIVQPTCGAADGSITISSPTPGVTYSIDGGQTFQASPMFGGLGAGSYAIVVESADGCTATASADLNPSDGPVLDDVTTTPADCGMATGTVTISATGTDLVFSIDGGTTFQTDNVFTGLPQGDVVVMVQDAAGCSSSTTVQVDGTTPPVIDDLAIAATVCGEDNGSITVTATGDGTLTYSIDGGTTFQPGNTFTDLPVGTYTVVVSNGCEVSEQADVPASEPPTIDAVDAVQPTCVPGSTGTIIIDATGDGALTYSVDGGATFQNDDTFTGLVPGSYDIVVADGNGCEVAGPITVINAAPPIDLDLGFVITPPSCDADDGALTITSTPEAVSFSIDGGTTFQASPVFNGLGAGTYTIVAANALGCTADTTAQLIAPNAPVIESVSIVDPPCGSTDGQITIQSQPGGLQYSIDGGTTYQADNTFSGLAAGTYTIVVLAPHGCTAGSTAQLTETPAPSITGITPTWPSCNGLSDGSIVVAADPATGVQYSVDGGTSFQASPTFNGLPAGTYAVVVQDGTGCTATQTVIIGDHPLLTVVPVVVQPSCNAPCGGAATAAANGGYGTYSYIWTNGASQQSVLGLCAGPYGVVVTDANGCQAATAFELFAPEPPVIDSLTIVNESCPGACDGGVVVHATGATTYALGSQPPQAIPGFNGLCPGTYSFTVEGNPDCFASATATVAPGSPVLAAFTADPWSTSTTHPRITFSSTSVNAVTQTWDFGGHGTSSEPVVSFEFPDNAAEHIVCLEVANAAGCTDEVCHVIVITPDGTIHVPNTFTPDDDGINDTFFVVADPAIKFIDMDIFDRWGERIFTSTSLDTHWDGRYNGVDCQDGVYVWRIRAQDPVTAEIRSIVGHVNLLR
jgi:gliding motility-associated-like protein